MAKNASFTGAKDKENEEEEKSLTPSRLGKRKRGKKSLPLDESRNEFHGGNPESEETRQVILPEENAGQQNNKKQKKEKKKEKQKEEEQKEEKKKKKKKKANEKEENGQPNGSSPPSSVAGSDREEEASVRDRSDAVLEEDLRPYEAMMAPILAESQRDRLNLFSAGSEKTTKAPPVLPWMRAPVEIGSLKEVPLKDVVLMDPRLRAALEKAGVSSLFPVQAAVWHETVGPGSEARDLCVCAATGSGKTFAYALPIVQGLASSIVTRLRALVVLPTRDLAVQVKLVFDAIAPSVGLKVAMAVGQTSLSWEARQLVASEREDQLWYPWKDGETVQELKSEVDILVATPGRLMDHLNETKGFSLRNLRYLVVDESDRLLRQSYQDWLPKALASINSSPPGGISRRTRDERFWDSAHIHKQKSSVLKMALSATLTRDPSKIGRLMLHHPLYITSSAVDHRYKLPSQLEEFKMVCEPGEKPLYLVALLGELKEQSTIVFTASVEATHRLYILLCSFEALPVSVVEYSSLQHQNARSAALEKFRSGEAQVLVASDAMTRGMDVDNVGNVVNYDVPVYAKTYVHRVGRTARAGRPGRAFTILRKEEVRHFKGLLRKADNRFCRDYRLNGTVVENLVPQYKASLEVLKGKVEEEEAVNRNRRLPVAKQG